MKKMKTRWLERLLIAIGAVCLVAVVVNVSAADSFQKSAAEIFERDLVSPPTPVSRGATIGRLEIPRLDLSVMVVEGDDDATLARAVGHLPGTSLPWEQGNAVLAGHRDTFFRPLKDLREGDQIRMTTTRGTFEYRVTRTQIVQPDDVSVLAPSQTRALTLVTCYPFVYIGRAPQRFIIHAR